MMSQLARRRQKNAASIRKHNRQELFKAIRGKMISQNPILFQKPIISDVLENFMDFTHKQLKENWQLLLEKIQNFNLQQLSDHQHDNFVSDLSYLLYEDVIPCPERIRFKKNQSIHTAALVAFMSSTIHQQQLKYWLKYMGQQDKQFVFASISQDQYSHQKWFDCSQLFNFVLDSLEHSISATYVFSQIFLLSDNMTKRHIDLCPLKVQSALLIAHKNQSLDHYRMLFMIWMDLTKIYINSKAQNLKATYMIQRIKLTLFQNIHLLLHGETIQSLNELYDVVLDDYLMDDFACQKLLGDCLKNIQQNENVLSDQPQLGRVYLFRLFYNNWRIKQLHNKKYYYSPNFYHMLSKIHQNKIHNPYYQKLLSIQPKAR